MAHNLEFDSRVMMAQYLRYFATPDTSPPPRWRKMFSVSSEKQFYCTMLNSKELCNIVVENKKQEKYVKFPKLIETFKTLFPTEPLPENLHDAKVDTYICLRCFIRLNEIENNV